MPLYQSAIFFRSEDFGWSEVYGQDTADIDSAIGFAEALIEDRKNLLGAGARIQWLRVYSADPNDHETRLLPIIGKKGESSILTHQTDRPYSAVMIELEHVGQPNGRIFMRGIPDEFVVQFSNIPTGFSPSGAWEDAFSLFRQTALGIGFRRIYTKRLNPGESPPQYDITVKVVKDLRVKKAVSRNTGRPINLPRGRQFAHRNQ